MAGIVADTSGHIEGTDTSLTKALTIGSGANRILIAGVFTNGGDVVTGVTWNGVAMTLIDKQERPAPSGRFVYLYYLVNPDSGNHNLVVSASSSVYLELMGASYTNAAQSGQPHQYGKNTSTGTSISNQLTSTINNCSHIGMFCNYAVVMSAGANTTLVTGTAGGDGLYISSSIVTPAGANTIACSLASSDSLACVTAMIAPINSIAYTKDFSETITMSEVFSTIYNRFKTFTETIDLTEVFTKVKKHFVEFVSDIFTMTDSMLQTKGKGWLEIITISEVFKIGITRIFSETVNLTEVLTKAITRIFPVDTFTLSDVVSRVKGKYQTLTDELAITDIFRRSMTRVFSEISNLTELFKKASTRILSDTSNLTDNLSKAFTRIFSDQTILSDIYNRILITNRTFTDNFTMTESFLAARIKNFLDSITISDWITNVLNKIGRLPQYISATVLPKVIGFLNDLKPTLGSTSTKPGMMTGVDKPTGSIISKDKPR